MDLDSLALDAARYLAECGFPDAEVVATPKNYSFDDSLAVYIPACGDFEIQINSKTFYVNRLLYDEETGEFTGIEAHPYEASATLERACKNLVKIIMAEADKK